ncbi:54S ribosomal protein L12, mitochondrial [Colletotrichum tanaceti]|uniref:54S ribosomal protein L12, mitochondrial n=1 Tax=Colletotrichum tanaceti TaxID=1306861 RepID=A0A4U6XMP7_9PEZI|nr:54S ribosomal protein L12, mitochondrial [Colletotrichum tanaceti]KAJ0167525.1 54S ribosomal protein L12, mitochondrial [Colletotrichum tanaceti]TKW56965.1 54S ribosomal protein L12, mitochondrial [Colletotrichum tanaceti]
MALSCRYAAQSCARQLRATGSLRASTSLFQIRTPATARRHNSTEAAAPTNPKIAAIVDQISTLTLLETADLVSSLKSKLNIPDLPVGGFAAAAPAAAPAAAAEVEEAAPAAAEKSVFNIKLTAFDAAAKAKVIKEVKNLLGLSLVDSKKFVESAPKLMKENVAKDEAEKIIATMKGLGATVTME